MVDQPDCLSQEEYDLARSSSSARVQTLFNKREQPGISYLEQTCLDRETQSELGCKGSDAYKYNCKVLKEPERHYDKIPKQGSGGYRARRRAHPYSSQRHQVDYVEADSLDNNDYEHAKGHHSERVQNLLKLRQQSTKIVDQAVFDREIQRKLNPRKRESYGFNSHIIHHPEHWVGEKVESGGPDWNRKGSHYKKYAALTNNSKK